MNSTDTRFTIPRFLVIALAIVPASYNWDFAKAWALLLMGMLIGVFLKPGLLQKRLAAFLWFALTASSLWPLLLWLTLPGWVVFLIWLVFSGLWVFEIAYPIRETWDHDFYWPPQKVVGSLLTLAILLLLAIHYGINSFLNKTFEMDWWVPAFWGMIAFLLFYPAKLHIEFSSQEKKRIGAFATVLVVLIMACQWKNHIDLKHRYLVLSSDHDPALYQGLAQESFRMGFEEIGAKSAVAYADYLLAQDEWPSAIRYLRSQWEHANRDGFAEAFYRPNMKGGDNLFYFALCFGAALQLQPGEQAIAFEVDRSQKNLYVLTSLGRLLKLNSNCSLVVDLEKPVLGFDYDHSQTRLAILSPNAIHIVSVNDGSSHVPISESRVWQDIAFRSSNELWLCDVFGRIESYMLIDEAWQHNKTVFPPLWGQEQNAQSMLLIPEAEACYLLDQFGAVHLRGEFELELDLDHHYHAGRPVMRGLEFASDDSDANQLLLLNQDGWVYYLPPDSKAMQVLFPPGEAVDFIYLPKVNTILQLYRHGWIVPFVVPQGAPVYPNEKIYRINTANTQTQVQTSQ